MKEPESKTSCHFISLPNQIDFDKYLVYHFDYDFMDGLAYLIVYGVDENGGYKIDKKYQL